MAVLGKIRALGPVALISVIGLALFAFVFRPDRVLLPMFLKRMNLIKAVLRLLTVLRWIEQTLCRKLTI